MRLSEARIPPKQPSQWTAEEAAIMQPFVDAGGDYNVFRTMLQHPDLMRRWLAFANHILFKSSLSFRQRELVILRIGVLCECGYEGAQHVILARKAGLNEAEINAARIGSQAPGISELDRLLLQATDELHCDAFISDTTWRALQSQLDTHQLMDLVFTVGQYNLVSMALNTFGVQLDDGLDAGTA